MRSRLLLLDLYAKQGTREKFDALLTDSLRIAPNDSDLLRVRTVRLSDVAELKVPPQTAEELLDLSLIYYQSRQYTDCIQAAKDALHLNPSYAEAYNNIAASWNALGNYEEGIEAAEKAVRLKPDFTLARNNLEWARSQQNRTRH
jgi:tetratricopeptide (TPR) repeat protein